MSSWVHFFSCPIGKIIETSILLENCNIPNGVRVVNSPVEPRSNPYASDLPTPPTAQFPEIGEKKKNFTQDLLTSTEHLRAKTVLWMVKDSVL